MFSNQSIILMQNSNQTFVVTAEMTASKGARFANLIIDLIVRMFLLGILWILALVFSAVGLEGLLIWLSNISPVQDIFVSVFLMVLYYGAMESLTQRTVGKIITGSKVVMADGSKPEPRTIVIRALCRFIPFEPFSFFGDRGWHDSITETYVVDVKKFNAAKELKLSFEQIGKEEA